MANVTNARDAKTQAHLLSLVIYNGRAMTRRVMIDMLLAEGWKPSVHEAPRVKPLSRIAYFRADQRTQDAHERRMRDAGNKTVYVMQSDDGRNHQDAI